MGKRAIASWSPSAPARFPNRSSAGPGAWPTVCNAHGWRFTSKIHARSTRPRSCAWKKTSRLARTLGAEVIDTADENLARGLLRIAQQSNVSQIILANLRRQICWNGFGPGNYCASSPATAATLICRSCARKKAALQPLPPRWRWRPISNWRQYGVAAVTLAMVGLLNVLLAQFTGPRVPGFIFLLAVVLLALFLGRGPVLFAGAQARWHGIIFFCHQDSRSSSPAPRTGFCSDFILSSPLSSASWSPAFARRNLPKDSARNARRRSIN